MVLAQTDDPRLPAGEIDLVFMCNAYHHFGDRVAYFQRLHASLAPGARLAIVAGKSSGAASWLTPKGHSLEPGQLAEELGRAGYRHLAEYDYLPAQSFDIFAADAEVPGVGSAR